jgi:GTP:adenosylcobinamide-phosphate guanylyltransferase
MSAAATALILAGSRGENDPLCAARNVSHKALIPVCGVPMVARVIGTLADSGRFSRILVAIERPELILAVPDIAQRVARREVQIVEAADSPSRSVLAALDEVAGAWPLLVTTADHPLLTREMIDYLFDEAEKDSDAVAGIVEEAVLSAAYPESKRTYLRFSDIRFSGANLFLLRTAKSAGIVAFWRTVERNRKRPLRLMSALGPVEVLRFVGGRLSLEAALRRLGRQTGARLGVVRLPFAEAAIDVDRLADLDQVERILTQGPADRK